MPNQYLDIDLQHISDQYLVRTSRVERVTRWFIRQWHSVTSKHTYVPLHGINDDFIHQVGWICLDCSNVELS